MAGSMREAARREDRSVSSSHPESIGAYLATQRRLRGITVEELARQTRIPLRSLERLEAGSFDGHVDGFVRGFVRTVAAALGLDADEALNRTLHEPAVSEVSGRAPRLSVKRVLATAAFVVLLGALGLAVQMVAISIAKAPAAGGSASAPIVVRRDPVRALAEAQGVAALSPAPALSLVAAPHSKPVAAPHSKPVAVPHSKPAAASQPKAAAASSPNAGAAPIPKKPEEPETAAPTATAQPPGE